MNNSFIAGLEELVARIISLILSILFFAVYSLAVGDITVNWTSIVSYMLIFWVVYEGLAYILYLIFKFFGGNNKPGDGLTLPIDEELELTPKQTAINTDASIK